MQVSKTTFLEFKYATMLPIKIILRYGIELRFLAALIDIVNF
jgi:hypothetical protein